MEEYDSKENKRRDKRALRTVDLEGHAGDLVTKRQSRLDTSTHDA
jgi:hypothetical protein